MIERGYGEFLGPLGSAELVSYWRQFLADHASHPLKQANAARLSRTLPIVLYGDEGTTGPNSFMLGTWKLF